MAATARGTWRRAWAGCLRGVILAGSLAAALADGVVSAQGQAQAQATLGPLPPIDVPPPAGHLLPAGNLPAWQPGATVSVLPDGGLLVYGVGQALHQWPPHARVLAQLRARHGLADSSGPDPAPKWWDAAAGGWRRAPEAPECLRGQRMLHTATVLPGGQVLVAGGLCDLPKLADDLSPPAPHTALSLWDGVGHRWLPAPTPGLQHARFGHSASLMPDGSVLIVGGEDDPARAPDSPDDAVLASVERVADGHVVPAPPLATPRALHAATVLADGTLLVSGGLDRHGAPIASVESLAPGATAWQALPPLATPRHGHTATLLEDGRVLVVGGVGPDGGILASTELWNPVARAWLPGPDQPLGLRGHAALRLAGGDVLVAGGGWLSGTTGQDVPWAWTWSPRTGEWDIAGRASPQHEDSMSSPVTLAPRADGSVLVATPAALLAWRAGPSPHAGTPAWLATPLATALPGRRVLFVGQATEPDGSQPGGERAARVWDAATDTWQAAPAPSRNGDQARLLALPSGRVLLLAVSSPGRQFTCDAWSPGQPAWSPCGTAPLAFDAPTQLQGGLLPDGRAFVVANFHEVLVKAAASDDWAPWAPDWATGDQVPAWGDPVRAERPLARVRDPAGGPWIPIDDAAARYLQRDANGRGPVMLWNPARSAWDYVLHGRPIGIDAQLLPDGCAISMQPFAVHDPRDGSVRALTDPGFGSDVPVMVVLDDGTVVAAGPGVGTSEAGAGFYHGRASCAGFERVPNYYSPGYVPAPPSPSTIQRTASPAGTAWRGLDKPLWTRRVATAAVAALLLVLGWRVWRRRPRVAVLLAWAGGIAGAGLLAVAVTRAVATWTHEASSAHPPPGATWPCALVGTWTATHGAIVRRVELRDDGRYAMDGNAAAGDPAGGYVGRWWVVGEALSWRDDRANLPLGTDTLLDLTPGHFQVRERDGRLTRFERIQAPASTTCKP